MKKILSALGQNKLTFTSTQTPDILLNSMKLYRKENSKMNVFDAIYDKVNLDVFAKSNYSFEVQPNWQFLRLPLLGMNVKLKGKIIVIEDETVLKSTIRPNFTYKFLFWTFVVCFFVVVTATFFVNNFGLMNAIPILLFLIGINISILIYCQINKNRLIKRFADKFELKKLEA